MTSHLHASALPSAGRAPAARAFRRRDSRRPRATRWPRRLEAAFAQLERDVLVVAGDFKRPLGSVSRGTVRATSTDDGLDVEIDLPVGAIGDEVVAAHEAAGVIVRPLIDFDRSEFTDTDRGREYTKPWVRALLVGATDTKSRLAGPDDRLRRP